VLLSSPLKHSAYTLSVGITFFSFVINSRRLNSDTTALTVKTSYTVYRVSSSHNCYIEKPAVQVYISPSAFITVNENMKRTSE
jgi:hypothetical protein